MARHLSLSGEIGQVRESVRFMIFAGAAPKYLKSSGPRPVCPQLFQWGEPGQLQPRRCDGGDVRDKWCESTHEALSTTQVTVPKFMVTQKP